MKLGELMEDLGCEYYYVVELDADIPIDACPEHYVSANKIDDYIRDMIVLNYDHVSKRFAVVYLDAGEKRKRESEDSTIYLDENELIDFLMKILK